MDVVTEPSDAEKLLEDVDLDRLPASSSRTILKPLRDMDIPEPRISVENGVLAVFEEKTIFPRFPRRKAWVVNNARIKY